MANESAVGGGGEDRQSVVTLRVKRTNFAMAPFLFFVVCVCCVFRVDFGNNWEQRPIVPTRVHLLHTDLHTHTHTDSRAKGHGSETTQRTTANKGTATNRESDRTNAVYEQ